MKKNKKILIKVRAIILYEGKLLLVKHPQDTSYAALPGGHLKWGEDVKECLARELIEELGVEPKIGRLLYINTFQHINNNQYVEFFFEINNGADYFNTDKHPDFSADELAEIIWVSPTDDIRILPKSLAADFRSGKIIFNEVRYIKD